MFYLIKGNWWYHSLKHKSSLLFIIDYWICWHSDEAVWKRAYVRVSACVRSCVCMYVRSEWKTVWIWLILLLLHWLWFCLQTWHFVVETLSETVRFINLFHLLTALLIILGSRLLKYSSILAMKLSWLNCRWWVWSWQAKTLFYHLTFGFKLNERYLLLFLNVRSYL